MPRQCDRRFTGQMFFLSIPPNVEAMPSVLRPCGGKLGIACVGGSAFRISGL